MNKENTVVQTCVYIYGFSTLFCWLKYVENIGGCMCIFWMLSGEKFLDIRPIRRKLCPSNKKKKSYISPETNAVTKIYFTGMSILVFLSLWLIL